MIGLMNWTSEVELQSCYYFYGSIIVAYSHSFHPMFSSDCFNVGAEYTFNEV